MTKDLPIPAWAGVTGIGLRGHTKVYESRRPRPRRNWEECNEYRRRYGKLAGSPRQAFR